MVSAQEHSGWSKKLRGLDPRLASAALNSCRKPVVIFSNSNFINLGMCVSVAMQCKADVQFDMISNPAETLTLARFSDVFFLDASRSFVQNAAINNKLLVREVAPGFYKSETPSGI